MVQQRRRRLTADMIGQPTNFVHFDGPSFVQDRSSSSGAGGVADNDDNDVHHHHLDESRCRSMFDRLPQRSGSGTSSGGPAKNGFARRLMFRSDSPPGECCFPTSLLIRPSASSSPSSSSAASASSNHHHQQQQQQQHSGLGLRRSGPIEISAPFNFVHIQHVSLESLQERRPVSTTGGRIFRKTEVAAL